MKKFAAVFIFALLLVTGFAMGEGFCADKVKVGILYEYGGMEQDFNALAYEGVEKAKQEYPGRVEVMIFNPGVHTTGEDGIRSLLKNGCDLIISVGGNLADVTARAAQENPMVKFALLDQKVPGLSTVDNLVCLTFKEQEASYLVGMAAALKTKTDTVGFIGAMDVPVIRRFEAGYVAGVKAVNPKIRILKNFVGDTPIAYKNFYQARELARAQIAEGADVLYHAASFAGFGVIEAAAANGRLAIGVDVDQSYNVPQRQKPYVLTSMIKRVDQIVLHTVERVLEDRFIGGYVDIGLKEGAVDYAFNPFNRDLLQDIQPQMDKAKKDIIEGRIIVPASIQ